MLGSTPDPATEDAPVNPTAIPVWRPAHGAFPAISITFRPRMRRGRDVVQLMCDRLGMRFETATRSVEERPGQDAAYVIDSSKARTELGWRPTIDLETGLNEVVDWVNDFWAEIQGKPLEYRHCA